MEKWGESAVLTLPPTFRRGVQVVLPLYVFTFISDPSQAPMRKRKILIHALSHWKILTCTENLLCIGSCSRGMVNISDQAKSMVCCLWAATKDACRQTLTAGKGRRGCQWGWLWPLYRLVSEASLIIWHLSRDITVLSYHLQCSWDPVGVEILTTGLFRYNTESWDLLLSSLMVFIVPKCSRD